MKAKIVDTKIRIMFKNKNEISDFFKQIMRFMGQLGFYVVKDKEIKKYYKTLEDKYRYGRYKDLEFKAQYYPSGIEIVFFQNLNYENPNGGYYDFYKYEKMPYLIKKQYELTEIKLCEFLKLHGFEIENARKKPKKGMEFIINDYITQWHHPQKEKFEISEIEGQTYEIYNSQDRDGNTIYNGQIKYFRDYHNGYVYRGTVYYNINNMWWVLLPSGEIKNIASAGLFDLKDTDFRGREAIKRVPKEYAIRKEQLSLCSIKELENELRRRKKKLE